VAEVAPATSPPAAPTRDADLSTSQKVEPAAVDKVDAQAPTTSETTLARPAPGRSPLPASTVAATDAEQQDAAAARGSAGTQSTCRAGALAFRACRQRAQCDRVPAADVARRAQQRSDRRRGPAERGAALARLACIAPTRRREAPDRPAARRFRGRWPGAPRRA
jgi:hypothetical protein